MKLLPSNHLNLIHLQSNSKSYFSFLSIKTQMMKPVVKCCLSRPFFFFIPASIRNIYMCMFNPLNPKSLLKFSLLRQKGGAINNESQRSDPKSIKLSYSQRLNHHNGFFSPSMKESEIIGLVPKLRKGQTSVKQHNKPTLTVIQLHKQQQCKRY